MEEKMLVTQALDERDLLVKKINSKINKLKFVDTKKRNEEKTVGERLEVEEFRKQALSSYQQITDLIDRYQRLDAAIVASNAETYIETERGTYSVAGAIALRNRLKGEGIYDVEGSFEDNLIDQFEQQYKIAVSNAANRNNLIERQAEDMRMSILGRDSRNRDDKPLEVVDAYIRENTTEIIDPLEAEKKILELKERKDALINELNTKIKVSNATTMIEF